MLFGPKCLSDKPLSETYLREDKQKMVKYGDCGLGEKAVYVGAFALPRMQYIPLRQVDRVFKRLAVSKGFYEKNKIFGSIAYLVIKYDGGKEKVFQFSNEDMLDTMLQAFRDNTNIPVGKP